MNDFTTPGALQLRSTNLFPTAIEKQTKRAVEAVAGRALVIRAREEARGYLANQILETTGALTALEQSINQAVPLAEARTKFIVDAYVTGAANTLMQFHG